MSEQVFDTMSVEQFADVLQSYGFNAVITTTEKGNKYISSRASGWQFSIIFSASTQTSGCMMATLVLWADGGKWSSTSVNKWNKEHLFSKAYFDDDSDLCLEYSILLIGVTRTHIGMHLGVWETQLSKLP